MSNWNSNHAHMVYASDDRFSEILAVSLVSLFENSMDMKSISIYILENGIKEENKIKIESIIEKYNQKPPVWIKAYDISQVLSMEITTDRGSISQYARLFISRSLPADLGRVLYLDCDIIIKKSIKELWNLDIQDKTIGALNDAFSKYYRANIDLYPEDIMFNSGVMLIDLNKWKDQKIEERLLDFIKKKKGRIQQGDQGALNAVLSHDTFCFEPKFNSVTIFYDFDYKEMMIYRKPPKGFYSERQIRKAIEEPHLIHFTTSFLSKRPWVKGCQHKYVGEWVKYKRLSPWKDAKLWEDNTQQWKRIINDFFHILPRGLMIRVAGIAQAYLRPWVIRITK